MKSAESKYKRRPHWLKIRLPQGANFYKVRDLVKNGQLHTVCESAHCPNLGECWGRKTATFLIMGNVCSRKCRFCAVDKGSPLPLDDKEPERVADAVSQLGLRYAVITSVTRDDLPDGGASQFAAVVKEIRALVPSCRIEVLIPDFAGDDAALRTVIDVHPEVINHNLETVQELYSRVRPQADYDRSLHLIRRVSDSGVVSKSGLMLGLGEEKTQVRAALSDLRRSGCQILTLGQYLQPSRNFLPVERFVPPEEFLDYKKIGMEMGFQHVESGPLVRSSYHADEQFKPEEEEP